MTDTTVDSKMTIDSTPALISNGQSLSTDSEGYLENLTDWNEDVAELIAKNEGLELTENHWQIIHLLRRFYSEYELSPAMRPLVKAVAAELGPEKGRSIHLMKLFPGSPAKVAARLAGLPKPDRKSVV